MTSGTPFRHGPQGEPPISPEEEDKRFRELWLENCTRRHPNPDELVQFIKRKASCFINWGDVGTLWKESPAEAIELWRALRLEARDEFFSGHYGARVFEVMSYDHEAWRRASYTPQFDDGRATPSNSSGNCRASASSENCKGSPRGKGGSPRSSEIVNVLLYGRVRRACELITRPDPQRYGQQERSAGLRPYPVKRLRK